MEVDIWNVVCGGDVTIAVTHITSACPDVQVFEDKRGATGVPKSHVLIKTFPSQMDPVLFYLHSSRREAMLPETKHHMSRAATRTPFPFPVTPHAVQEQDRPHYLHVELQPHFMRVYQNNS